MTGDRERASTAAFVAIANSLADGCDAVELFSGLTSDCARLLDVTSAGLLLADGFGVLHVMGASSERTRDLELFQLQRQEGPCLDCFAGGTAVLVPDLVQERERWPQFVAAAAGAGFASVHALPMRLHGTVLGALGLFGGVPGPLPAEDLALGQALAHVAGIALVSQAVTDSTAVGTQLQTVLRHRVMLEQAKGLLAELGGLDTDVAFAALRRYAQDNGERLSETARRVVARELTLRDLTADSRAAPALTGPDPRAG